MRRTRRGRSRFAPERAVFLLAVGTVLLLAGVRWAGSWQPDFPGQLPGSHSDVSQGQALRDHRITLPVTARAVQYSANLHTSIGDYPMAARLAFSCTETNGFIALNTLIEVPHWYQLLDGSVYDLATNLGWRADTPGARWYQRLDGNHTDLTVLIQPAGRLCTAYLVADQYTE